MSSPSALIVGAGIGGLAAAIGLRRAGWSVRVLERAGHPRELGFALLLAPNAIHALRELGIADGVIDGGATLARGEMRRPDGTILRALDTSRVTAALGEPTVFVLRPVLHGLLLGAVRDALQLGQEVVAVESGGGRAIARLASGTTVEADLLVGADGLRSVVRRQLHPREASARSSGLVGIRGVAFDVQVPVPAATAAQYFGRGVEAGLTPAGRSAVYWFMSLRADDLPAGADLRDPRAAIASALQAFEPGFRAVVAATLDEDMRIDELVDREPLSEWGRGPLTLLGDAAHPMLPHAGQGAAQAIEDAVALARLVRPGQALEFTLRAYERLRGARTAAVVQLSRRNAAVGSIRHPALCRGRDWVLRHVPAGVILRSLVALGRAPEA